MVGEAGVGGEAGDGGERAGLVADERFEEGLDDFAVAGAGDGLRRCAMTTLHDKLKCRNLIISGGIKSYLDGYYLMQKAGTNAVYAQASAFLKHATGDYETLRTYCELQKKGLETCYGYLKIKE